MMKLAVITGCDSGLGKHLAELMVKSGYNLVISYLEENPFSDNPKVYPIKLDLRKDEEIKAFAQFVMDKIQEGFELKYLINNAGVATGGPLENIPMQMLREAFEINFFGQISLTQKLIPSLINRNGRLVIVGSLAGKLALPFVSPYATSKFAVEGLSDCLRRELAPFGVKTILIEPSAAATPIWNKAKKQDQSFVDERYKKGVDRFLEKYIAYGNNGMNPEIAAKEIFEIIHKKNPKPRYIISKSKLIANLLVALPDSLKDRLIGKMFPLEYED